MNRTLMGIGTLAHQQSTLSCLADEDKKKLYSPYIPDYFKNDSLIFKNFRWWCDIVKGRSMNVIRR